MTTLYDILKGSTGNSINLPQTQPAQSMQGFTGNPNAQPTYSLPNGGGMFSATGPTNMNGAASSSVLSPDQFSAVQGLFANGSQPKSPAPTQSSYTPPSHDDIATAVNNSVDQSQQMNTQQPDQESAPVTSPFSDTLATATSNPLGTLYKLREEQANDRFNNTGAYHVDPAWGLSPDEVRQIRDTADKHYEEVQSALQLGATQQIYQMKNSLGGDYEGIPVKAQGAAQNITNQYTNEANKTVAPILMATQKADQQYNSIKKMREAGQAIPGGNDYALIEQFILSQNPGTKSVKQSTYDAVNSYFQTHPDKFNAELSKWVAALPTSSGEPTGQLSPAAEKTLIDIIHENADATIGSFNDNNRSNYLSNLNSLGIKGDAAEKLLPKQGESYTNSRSGSDSSSKVLDNNGFASKWF